jgi:hypothetical protein
MAPGRIPGAEIARELDGAVATVGEKFAAWRSCADPWSDRKILVVLESGDRTVISP